MRHRLLFSAPAIAIAGLLLAATSERGEARSGGRLSLPAQELGRSLRQLALESGVSIVAPDELVRGRTAPAVNGAYSAAEALSQLLAGSGLEFRRIDGSFVIAAANPAKESEAALVITGTHLRSAAPTSPVITLTRRDIEAAAPASLEELMRKLPQNLSAGVAQENFAVTGTGADITDHGAGIDLRGLGQRATLVLVNGRRVAPSGTGSFVDISLIPVSAIERIEILSDGASAIYGSDAVAGVVNIILRTDFRGLETLVQAGTSTRGGGDQLLLSGTAGLGWRGGHAMIAYERRAEGEIKASERTFTINLPGDWSLFPKEHRDSLFASGRQQIAPGLSLDVTGILSSRRTIRSFFIAGPAVPVNADARARYAGATAALEAELPAGWRGELSASYFRSKTAEAQLQPQGSGLVNRLDTLNWVSEAGVKADGPLFSLGGGDAKLALGAELRREHYSSLFETQVNGQILQSGGRTVGSLFGEVSLPFAGPTNARPGLQRLVATAAGRLEHYQGLGSSFNPKLGLLWSPVAGLALRGSYGTSFRAPLLSESLGLYNAYLFPASLLYLDPSQAPPGVGAALIGSDPAVKPERSNSLSLGTQWTSPKIPGLDLGATYYRIRFSNRITIPSEQIVVVGDPALEPIVTRDPSLSLVTGLLAGAAQVLDFSGPGFTNGGASPSDIVVIVDARASNTAETKTSGIDLEGSYSFDLRDSRVTLNLNANRILRFDDRLTSASPVIHTLGTPFHPVKWRARAGLSWAKGPLSLFAFLNYTSGYRDNRGEADLKVARFVTVDGGISYSSPSSADGLGRNVRIAVTAQNLFDADPPRLLPEQGFDKGIGYDPVNATGRGRTIAVQLRKSW